MKRQNSKGEMNSLFTSPYTSSLLLESQNMSSITMSSKVNKESLKLGSGRISPSLSESNKNQEMKNSSSTTNEFNKLSIKATSASINTNINNNSTKIKTLLLNLSKNSTTTTVSTPSFSQKNNLSIRPSTCNPSSSGFSERKEQERMTTAKDGHNNNSSTSSFIDSIPLFSDFIKFNEDIETEKTISNVSHSCPRLDIGVAQLQGRRAYMEDRYIKEDDFIQLAVATNMVKEEDGRGLFPEILYPSPPKSVKVYGVFDGHGGSNCVNYITANILKTLIESFLIISTASTNYYREESIVDLLGGVNDANDSYIKTVLTHCCKEIESEITTLSRNHKWKSGSCFLMSVIVDNKLYMCNIGDSRGIGLEGTKTFPLSFDHNPYRPDEKKRILAAGGDVRKSNGTFRVYPGGIAVARALGDYPIKIYPNVLSAEPEVTVKTITPLLKYVVLCSDGVYDVLTNNDVIGVASKSKGAQEGAINIVQRAYDRFSNDNLTALVIKFE